ncbi:hypothetical protein KUTeg_002090 [Tegillarca granosa]|uniref:Uncharacterized protein n=1 Tax=Tegillarca granosa TaxID=220873 RepID=A0ABQ9FXR9_TEGGR|nr:hypothetical protein KUTeg_002090 [Tegillarca granosa]
MTIGGIVTSKYKFIYNLSHNQLAKDDHVNKKYLLKGSVQCLKDQKKFLPDKVKPMVRCELPDNCFGLQCCLDIKFKIPFGDAEIQKNIPFWFKFSPCTLHIDVGFGTYRFETELFEYEWVCKCSSVLIYTTIYACVYLY